MKNKLSHYSQSGFLYFALLIYTFIVVFPMVWIILSSFKTNQELYNTPWSLPLDWRWSNYAKAWIEANIGRCFLNSIVVTFFSLIFTLLFGAMAAYVLARFNFKGNNAIFYTFIAGMIFPIFLGLVPLFFLLKKLHLLNSLVGLILIYIAYSLPFTIFVLTAYFKTLPKELEEAAVLDGCSIFSVFWKVMLPLAKPGLVTVGIFNVIGIWNQYLLALITITDPKLRTLPLGIANLLIIQQYRTDWGALLAGLVIVISPVVIAYGLFQSRITEGMTVGALKG